MCRSYKLRVTQAAIGAEYFFRAAVLTAAHLGRYLVAHVQELAEVRAVSRARGMVATAAQGGAHSRPWISEPKNDTPLLQVLHAVDHFFRGCIADKAR